MTHFTYHEQDAGKESHLARMLLQHLAVHGVADIIAWLPNTGKQGDLSSAAGEGGEAPKWPIPTGVLTYFHIPGHSPGQLAWTHVPSKTVFGGDIFEILLTKTPAKTPGITLTWPSELLLPVAL